MSSLKDVFFHDVTISGSLTKAGDAENLFVDGTTTLRKTLAVDGAATLSDTLTVGQESPYFTGSASMIGHMRHFPYTTQTERTFGIAEVSASLAASASFSAEKINKGFNASAIAFIFNNDEFQGLLPVFGDIVHITANGSNSKSESAAIRTKIALSGLFPSADPWYQTIVLVFEDNIINNEHDFSTSSEFNITEFSRFTGFHVSVTGATTLSGSLTVTGATTLEDLVVNESTVLKDLVVSGTTTLSGSLIGTIINASHIENDTVTTEKIKDYAVNSLKLDPIRVHRSPEEAASARATPSSAISNVYTQPSIQYIVGTQSSGGDHGRVFFSRPDVSYGGSTNYYLDPLLLGQHEFCPGTTYRFIGHNYRCYQFSGNPTGNSYTATANTTHKVTINQHHEQPAELESTRLRSTFDGFIVHHPSDVEYGSYSINTGFGTLSFQRAVSHPRVVSTHAFERHIIEIENYESYDITLISGLREFPGSDKDTQVVWHVTGTVTGPWSTSTVQFVNVP